MDPERLLDGRLKLRHLTLVTTIAREGTLLRTAQVLHVTQPVVTRSLREVESVLEVELFTRGPRGVRPTSAGLILIDHAQRVLGSIRAAGTRIAELQRVGIEPVRVGTNLASAYSLVPQAMIELKRAHPNLSASVAEAGPEQLISSLMRSEVDLLVGRLQPVPATESTPIRRVRLYDEPVRLVVRVDHPALGWDPDRLDLENLLCYPWVLPNAPSPLRSEIDELFSSRDLPRPADVIECATALTVQAILIGTDAIAPFPALIGSMTPGLALLDIDLHTVPRAIGIMTLDDAHQPSSVQEFIRILKATAAQLRRDSDLLS